MMSPLIAAVLIQQPTSPLRDFSDWVAGCDNGRVCQASAYAPWGGDEDRGATLTLRRGPRGSDLPEIWLSPLGEQPIADVVVNGRPFRLRLTTRDNVQHVDRADALRFARALADAKVARVQGRDGRDLGPLLTSGAKAALLWLDERQARLGTVGALVRIGTRSDAAVPAPPILPVVRAAPAASRRPVVIGAGLRRRLLGSRQCVWSSATHAQRLEVAALDARHDLIVTWHPCDSGAYNHLYAVHIRPVGRAPVPARFDVQPDAVEDASRVYNVHWDPKTRRLYSGFKGRGVGDCGSSSHYAWGGQRFRLVYREAMNDCRQIGDFITTFRARVIE